MAGASNRLTGETIGRFRITNSSGEMLQLGGRWGRGIIYGLIALLIGAWAATAWISVVGGHHGNLDAALAITVLSFVFLALVASTLGASIIVDGKSRSITSSSLFGLSTRRLKSSDVPYISIMVTPATAKTREKIFLHMMNEQQLVELYVCNVRTGQKAAVTVLRAAEEIRSLLQLQPRCEGTPGVSRNTDFELAFKQWAATCPGGVQPLRRRVAG